MISLAAALAEQLRRDLSQQLRDGELDYPDVALAEYEKNRPDPLGEIYDFGSAIASIGYSPVSLAAELLKPTGLLDEVQTSVVTGDEYRTRPDNTELPGTQEWMMDQMGADPYSNASLLGYFIDPASNSAMLGPALRKLISTTGKLPRSMQWLETSPRWKAELIGEPKTSWGGETAELSIDPIVPEHWQVTAERGGYKTSPHYDEIQQSAIDRNSTLFYDPQIAALERKTYMNDQNGLPMAWRTTARLPEGYSAQPKISPADEMAWRGMSAEEMDSIANTGRIESNQSMNLSGQAEQGATSFGTRPDQARIYATDFAHMRDRPTPDYPGYLVGVKRENIDEIPGLSPVDEIDARPLDARHIEQIYRAEPYAIRGGNMGLYRDSLTGMEWKEHGASAPAIQLHWRGDTLDEQAALIEELRRKLRLLKEE